MSDWMSHLVKLFEFSCETQYWKRAQNGVEFGSMFCSYCTNLHAKSEILFWNKLLVENYCCIICKYETGGLQLTVWFIKKLYFNIKNFKKRHDFSNFIYWPKLVNLYLFVYRFISQSNYFWSFKKLGFCKFLWKSRKSFQIFLSE